MREITINGNTSDRSNCQGLIRQRKGNNHFPHE